MRKTAVLIFTLLLSLPLFAQDALVDGAWLKGKLGDKNLFILDIQDPGHYHRYHVPGAINAPYGIWRTSKKSPKSGMLPPQKRVEAILRKLGVSNDSTVIIVATGMGGGDMAAAARVFWTLKSMGHDKVAILNGGLAAYANRFGGKLEAKANKADPTNYKAVPTKALSADVDAIKSALNNKTQLLDARTLGEFSGVVGGGKGQRSGTIPGSKHLPFDWFVGDDGFIRNKAASNTLFKASGLDSSKDGTIHFCQSGNRASLSWFVDYAIFGNKNAKLYDASMGEWGKQKELPIETRIKL